MTDCDMSRDGHATVTPTSAHAVGFAVSTAAGEYLVRFDLFDTQAAMEAWLRAHSPARVTPGVRAATIEDLEPKPGRPRAWIALCREHTGPPLIAHEAVHAMQFSGVEGAEEQAVFVEQLVAEGLAWLSGVTS